MKTIKVKFDKGINTIHVPFLPPFGAFGELKHQISRIEYPKAAKRIEASFTVSYDLDGDADWELAEVRVMK